MLQLLRNTLPENVSIYVLAINIWIKLERVGNFILLESVWRKPLAKLLKSGNIFSETLSKEGVKFLPAAIKDDCSQPWWLQPTLHDCSLPCMIAAYRACSSISSRLAIRSGFSKFPCNIIFFNRQHLS